MAESVESAESVSESGGIGLASSGGGMRTAHFAGAFEALKRKFKFKPSVAVASSGSVASLIYGLAEQHELGKKIWTRAVASARFISFLHILKCASIFDFRYLIDDIFRHQYPPDQKTLSETGTKYFIALSDVKTKQIRYITNDDIRDGVDIFEVMRATKAVKFLTPPVSIQGRLYEDGETRSTLGSKITKVLNERVEGKRPKGVIVVDDRTDGEQRAGEKKRKRDDVFIIPSYHAPAGQLTIDPAKVGETYDMGFRQVMESKSLEKFFERNA